MSVGNERTDCVKITAKGEGKSTENSKNSSLVTIEAKIFGDGNVRLTMSDTKMALNVREWIGFDEFTERISTENTELKAEKDAAAAEALAEAQRESEKEAAEQLKNELEERFDKIYEEKVSGREFLRNEQFSCGSELTAGENGSEINFIYSYYNGGDCVTDITASFDVKNPEEIQVYTSFLKSGGCSYCGENQTMTWEKFEAFLEKMAADAEALRAWNARKETYENDYDAYLKEWVSAMEEASAYKKDFEKGDGTEEQKEEEEDNPVLGKVKQYGAEATATLVKMGIKTVCGDFADCFDGPLKDLTNSVFGIEGDMSTNDLAKKMDSQTSEIIKAINDAEKNIVKRQDLNSIANSQGEFIDEFSSAANRSKKNISQFSTKSKPDNEKLIDMAYELGNLNSYSEKNIVKSHDMALRVVNEKYVCLGGDDGSNLFDIAYKKGVQD